MTTGVAYFLVYRHRSTEHPNWQEPTGGLEMECPIFDGKIAPDYGLAFDVICQRYHFDRGEALHMREVFKPEDQYQAHLLHRSWDRDAHEFKQLMEVE